MRDSQFTSSIFMIHPIKNGWKSLGEICIVDIPIKRGCAHSPPKPKLLVLQDLVPVGFAGGGVVTYKLSKGKSHLEQISSQTTSDFYTHSWQLFLKASETPFPTSSSFGLSMLHLSSISNKKLLLSHIVLGSPVPRLEKDRDWTGPRLPKTGNSQDCQRPQLWSSLRSLMIPEISRLTKDQSNWS